MTLKELIEELSTLEKEYSGHKVQVFDKEYEGFDDVVDVHIEGMSIILSTGRNP